MMEHGENMKEYEEISENMKKYMEYMKKYPYYKDSWTWKYSEISPST